MTDASAALKEAGGDPSGWYIPSWNETADQEINSELGIATAILSVTAPGPCIEKDAVKAAKLARDCNEEVAALKRKNPANYGFFASVPSLFDTDLAIQEITYAFDKLDADGVILLTRYGKGNGYLGDPAFRPVRRILNERHATVLIHPTHPVDTNLVEDSLPQPMFDYPHETGRSALSLIVSDTLRTAASDCKIILSHAGGTLPTLIYRVAVMMPETPMSVGKSTEEMVGEASNFYFDTAISASAPALRALYAIAKPGHVLFGTDYPNAPRKSIFDFTNRLETSTDLKEPKDAIFRQSALALFPRLQG